MKARILIDDAAGRFKAGEVGDLLSNDFDKYDYFVELPGEMIIPAFIGRDKPLSAPRRFYFHADEVELIDDAGPEHSDGPWAEGWEERSGEDEDEIERARRLV